MFGQINGCRVYSPEYQKKMAQTVEHAGKNNPIEPRLAFRNKYLMTRHGNQEVGAKISGNTDKLKQSIFLFFLSCGHCITEDGKYKMKINMRKESVKYTSNKM